MTTKTACKVTLENLQHQKILPPSYSIGDKKILQSTSIKGNYTHVYFGTYKEIKAFLDGIFHVHMLNNYPTNKTVNP